MPERTGTGWELLFKLNQLLLPFVIAWAIWATVAIFESKAFAGKGERYTRSDSLNTELRIQAWHNASLERQMREIEKELKRTNKELGAIRLIMAQKGWSE